MADRPEFETPMGLSGPKTLRISRSSWTRGTGDSHFLNGDGCRCILGFVLAAFGVEDATLLATGDLDQLTDLEQGLVEGALFVDTPTSYERVGGLILAHLPLWQNMACVNDAKEEELAYMLSHVLLHLGYGEKGSDSNGLEEVLDHKDDPQKLREEWLKYSARKIGIELVFE